MGEGIGILSAQVLFVAISMPMVEDWALIMRDWRTMKLKRTQPQMKC